MKQYIDHPAGDHFGLAQFFSSPQTDREPTNASHLQPAQAARLVSARRFHENP
jgi:hypothetical protein